METKVRIMETAFKLFLKKGFADVSLNEIIRESDTQLEDFTTTSQVRTTSLLK